MLYEKYIHIGSYGVYSPSWTHYNTYLTLPIFFVHFKDIKIKTDKVDQAGSIMAPTLEYGSPTLPRMGDINLGKFVSALMDTDYECPAVIESEDMAFNNLKASRKKCVEPQLSESICVLIIHSTEKIIFTYES